MIAQPHESFMASESSPGRYVPPALRARASPEVSRARTSDRGYSRPASPRLPGQSENPDPAVTRINTVTVDVFGDSFVGPLSLLDAEQVRIHRFKGASAKGLNNPNSVKQVAKVLVPAVNRVLAPPPYVYTPPTSKYALFIFGNVDLQINYLYQLQTKSLQTIVMQQAESEYPTPPPSATILENATETPSAGPALGPVAFVETISEAYQAFLQREIVDGPIGERVRSGRRGRAKVVVAGGLPPFVADEMLERIVDKYVVRLEDSHAANEALIREEEGTELSMREADAAKPKTPLSTLLQHDPPLCTLSVRRRMTDMFNERMAAYCALHPEELAFVDVGAMMDRDEEGINTDLYACPIDPTNIHPVWETTLPLWMRSLKAAGVDVTQLHMSADAEETFRAYEKEKRERTAGYE